MPHPELELVQQIRKRAASSLKLRGTGIGDDCAIFGLPRRHEALVTTDYSLENVHFRRAWHPADTVGHRCLARGLSDIAAMGGLPVAAFLSLALPDDLPQAWVDSFLTGLLTLAKQFKVSLAGGDTAQSPDGILADIVVVGSIPSGKAVLRSGARPGDSIFLTGRLGESAAVLQQLQDDREVRTDRSSRHFYPEPRIAIGKLLREKKLAAAMIDVSDGLSSDLHHICQESGTGAIVYADAIPRVPGEHGLRLALHGGEDYELLFTARAGRKVPDAIAGVPVTRIGEIIRGKHMRLALPDGSYERLEPRGWQHFA